MEKNTNTMMSMICGSLLVILLAIACLIAVDVFLPKSVVLIAAIIISVFEVAALEGYRYKKCAW